MGLAVELSISLRVVIRAAGVGGCLVVLLAGCSNDTAGHTATTAQSVPPEGATDPMNRAVLVEGGAFVSGSDDWTDNFPIGSPYS